MTRPKAPPARSHGMWGGRLAAVALSIALHGAAAAAFLILTEDDLPAPGGAISVELIATVPGGSAGAHAAAHKPKPEPDDAAREAAPSPTEPELSQPAKTDTPELTETEAPEERAEPDTPVAEDTAAAPQPAPTDVPVAPAFEAPGETAIKPKAAPEAARRLAEAARPKLADKPSAKAEATAEPPPKPKPRPKTASKLPPRPEPRHEAAPDPARDGGTAGPSGAAAASPEVAAVERTAPGFAVGSGANPLPDYPYRARRLGHQGRVVLKVAVSPNGTPVEVEIAASSGHDSLDDAARDAVRRWRFTPARVGGVPVAGTVEVPITFRLVGERGP